MRRRKTGRALFCSLLAALTGAIGCQTPSWWAYRSLGCVPGGADRVAAQYMEVCGSAEELGAVGGEPGESASDISGGKEVLRLPKELPGAQTPELAAPLREKMSAEGYREALENLYPPLGKSQAPGDAMPSDAGGVSSLDVLHQMARENHPGLRGAAAKVESARGLMVQAGLPPNPSVGYQSDTVRTMNTNGYHGAYLQQTIITARKLGLGAEAAAIDYANAMVEQRKAWVTITSGIRRAYFDVLASRQRMVLANAFFELTQRAYEAQVQLVKAGEAAPYEPLQLRVILAQARAALIKAEQESIANWRRLAAAVGCPDLPASALTGKIDCSVPVVSYEEALARMTAVHTDLEIAQNSMRKQQTLVTLADRAVVPDLNVGVVLQRDYTFEPGTTTYNLVLGGDLPVLNRNQGNRVATRAQVVQASQQIQVTRNELIASLAEVYGRYESNRLLAETFQSDALRDQVRAYRGVYQRYLADPSSVSFNDVIVAQQTVATVLGQYLDILQAQWQSLVDLGELLQVDDLLELGPLTTVAPISQMASELPGEIAGDDAVGQE